MYFLSVWRIRWPCPGTAGCMRTGNSFCANRMRHLVLVWAKVGWSCLGRLWKSYKRLKRLNSTYLLNKWCMTSLTISCLAWVRRRSCPCSVQRGAMEHVKQLLQGTELDNRTAALWTGAACCVGALVMLVRKVNVHQKTKEKIQRARNRRTESLQRAEQAVLQYKETVTADTHTHYLNCY